MADSAAELAPQAPVVEPSRWAPLAPATSLEEVLRGFDPASRELLAARELQKRVDRKYLFRSAALPELLARLQGDYRLVLARAQARARYSSLYFDTAELEAYHDHRRGRRPRYKVRIRHHVDRGRSYLEIKCKGNADKTAKARQERCFGSDEVSEEDARFIAAHCHFPEGSMLPTLWTHFTRVTLVGVNTEERVTLDCDMRLERAGHVIHLPHIAIGEIKQPRLCHTSPVVAAFRALRLKPMSASKYCVAVARLGLSPRTQAFAPTLKSIRRTE